MDDRQRARIADRPAHPAAICATPSGAMYVDEVYKSVGAVQALQIYDLDRVEVLRGPQGTLYGKNATGGAVSFYSANPSLTSTNGYVTAGVGNFSDYSVRAAAGTPIIDGALGVRAAVMY